LFALVVGHQHDVLVTQDLVVVVLPLLGAAGVAGRDNADLGEVINVLLALDDQHDALGVVGARGVVEGAALGGDGSGPFAGAVGIGAALAETFGFIAHHLHQEIARDVVEVVVSRHDLATALLGLSATLAAQVVVGNCGGAASRARTVMRPGIGPKPRALMASITVNGSQPAWQWTRSLPSFPSDTLREAVLSLWAGHRTI
jgi:hypothetical protein